MSGRVLHTGQAIVDIVMRVDRMPPIGGDVYAHDSELTAGGGYNVMSAAARDGADVVYLGTTGDGQFGRIVRDALAAEGISSPTAPRFGKDTGYCVAIVDQNAERTFVSYLGAEGTLRLDDLQAVDVSDEDIVYVSGYSLLHEPSRTALLAWLPSLPSATRILFDPSPLVAEIPDDAFRLLLSTAWLWTLNARESRIVLERLGVVELDSEPGASGADASRAAAPTLARVIAGRVLVRDGDEGAFLADATGDGEQVSLLHVPSTPVVPVDTNGAGDAHTGVLAAHLARGGALVEAVRRANVAAAVAVTRPGPATSPISQEIDALLDTYS